MTLHGFLGDRAERDSDLPSAPTFRASEGQSTTTRMPGGGNPWQRKVREEAPPSRSESSNNWRSVGGRTGGGGGGSSWGSRDRGPRNPWDDRRGEGLERHSNRFDTQEDRRWGSQDSRRWGGRTQDPRFSGGRTQDPRFSGRDVDTRPAHLRNRFKKTTSTGPARDSGVTQKEAKKTEPQRRLTPEERAARERSKQWDDQKLKGAKAVKLKHTDEERVARETEKMAELEQQEIEYTNPKSPLELALDPEYADATDIIFEELTESFRRFDIKKTDAKASAVALSSSLLTQKFTMAEFCSSIQVNLRSQKATSAVVAATLKEVFAKGNRTFLKLLGKVELSTINALINTGQTDEEYDAFLKAQNLLFLKAVPDMSDEVSQTLESSSAAETLALIDSKVDSVQTPSQLIPVVSTFVLNRVFEGKQPNVNVITEWAPVLLRCLSDLASEISILFTAQRLWYKKTKGKLSAKGQIRSVMEKLHECDIVSFDALAAWRDDRTTKCKGKPQALLGVSTWITEITPPPPEEEEDEEEEDEEIVDEYLRNPNSEFF